MASKRPLQSLLSTPSCSSLRTAQSSRQTLVRRTSACASFSTTTPSQFPEHQTEGSNVPRWQQTPPRMRAPFRIRAQPKGPVFRVNEDPRKLDDVYNRMLGQGGDKMLSDEVKWLAVTHKSFEHGARGFNDRLAFLGKRIVSLQTSLAFLSNPQPDLQWPLDAQNYPLPDRYGRTPFLHSALRGLPGLSDEASVLDKTRLANIAERYGLDKVARWKPKRTDDLLASGQHAVLATSLYAVIGAVALERGGAVANHVTQQKILAPLGFAFNASSSPSS
ncbi:unnamed protein product [Periconia digitata]|uniref:RNase III domain-containing protein n=1 Tax=Periconia digitata TaxID=1303443 RepID=A0A9W4U8C0_9PLEO|nr:unnamed protein product [Periconia digitata]